MGASALNHPRTIEGATAMKTIAALLVMATTLAGCIVVPSHHHHGHYRSGSAYAYPGPPAHYHGGPRHYRY